MTYRKYCISLIKDRFDLCYTDDLQKILYEFNQRFDLCYTDDLQKILYKFNQGFDLCFTDDLRTDYQFTFNLSKNEDRHYTGINFMNIPMSVSRLYPEASEKSNTVKLV